MSGLCRFRGRACSVLARRSDGGGWAACQKRTDWSRPAIGTARGIIAIDFIHVDTVLLRRVYALIVIEHGTRRARANAICERVIGILRRELLDRLLIVNERHLRQLLTEYLKHYNTARPHRSLGQRRRRGCRPSTRRPGHCRRPARRADQGAAGQHWRRGAGPRRSQDPADRSRPHPVPQAEQLALDAPVAPAGVLACQLLHQRTDLRWNRRPSRRIRMRPFSS